MGYEAIQLFIDRAARSKPAPSPARRALVRAGEAASKAGSRVAFALGPVRNASRSLPGHSMPAIRMLR